MFLKVAIIFVKSINLGEFAHENFSERYSCLKELSSYGV